MLYWLTINAYYNRSITQCKSTHKHYLHLKEQFSASASHHSGSLLPNDWVFVVLVFLCTSHVSITTHLFLSGKMWLTSHIFTTHCKFSLYCHYVLILACIWKVLLKEIFHWWASSHKSLRTSDLNYLAPSSVSI